MLSMLPSFSIPNDAKVPKGALKAVINGFRKATSSNSSLIQNKSFLDTKQVRIEVQFHSLTSFQPWQWGAISPRWLHWSRIKN